MKRVLITGKNSYVGTNVERWLMREQNKYYVETISLRDSNWKEFDFSKFDVVFHVAGIAHVATNKSMKDLYFKVNRDLAIETARISKESGVKQFIFMSSIIVYNSKEKKISIETIPKPNNFYGQSKLEAEEGIVKLSDTNFKVTIVRPPMIYGPKSKGNFSKLVKLSKKKIIVFPEFNNKRSMLYIGNLSIFIKYIIDNEKYGIFFPQNIEYSNVTSIIKSLSIINGRKILFTKILNPIIYFLRDKFVTINKIFGDYYYDIFDDVLINYKSFYHTLIETDKMELNE